ncbi:MAG: hypothetical protein LAO08_16485 [Acidobacteriia bacterium]|nr:hypothetical protein [Terriglobia bacterium]
MNGKENPIELLVICAVVFVLSLLGIVGGFSKGLFGNMDGILILGICLMMALIAAILLLVLAKEQGWLGKKSNGESSGSTPAAAK